MLRPRVRLAMRDWDHVTPLLAAAVAPDDFDLALETRTLTPDVSAEPDLDGGETSFSRYALARARGDDRWIGLPVFVMRGFRHRCILVRTDSPLAGLSDLAGRRVGLTGWPDSGNTWTRAVLREAGVDLAAIEWFVGPLTAADVAKPTTGLPENVHALPAGDSLVAGLLDGRFDAIFTPFMPPGFHEPGSPIRHLLEDYPRQELDYFRRTGFVPGIHLLTMRRALAESNPWLPAAVVDLFEESKQRWHARRRFLADTTPWLLADIDLIGKTIGADWMPYGVKQNAGMTAAFCTELHAQGVAQASIDPDSIFADFAALPAAG